MQSEGFVWFKQGSYDGLCGFYAALNALWDLCPSVRNLSRRNDLKYSSFGDRRDEQAFFDEAIEILARVGGTSLRILRGHPAVGGIDSWQIEELISRLSIRLNLKLTVDHIGEKSLEFPEFKLLLRHFGDIYLDFAVIGHCDNGGHWQTLVTDPKSNYKIIDPSEGEVSSGKFSAVMKAFDHRGGLVLGINR